MITNILVENLKTYFEDQLSAYDAPIFKEDNNEVRTIPSVVVGITDCEQTPNMPSHYLASVVTNVYWNGKDDPENTDQHELTKAIYNALYALNTDEISSSSLIPVGYRLRGFTTNVEGDTSNNTEFQYDIWFYSEEF
jgi:hypothetical protein